MEIKFEEQNRKFHETKMKISSHLGLCISCMFHGSTGRVNFCIFRSSFCRKNLENVKHMLMTGLLYSKPQFPKNKIKKRI